MSYNYQQESFPRDGGKVEKKFGDKGLRRKDTAAYFFVIFTVRWAGQ